VQQVDLTTLTAAVREIKPDWVPARIETVYQSDRHTIALGLRTLSQRGWLTLAWHPQAARMGLTSPPPRLPDTFTFSQQLRSILGGLALVEIAFVSPWERAIDLQFAQRPGEEPRYHLYLEIIGKYSNAILTDADGTIVTTAHQVSAQQSSVRTIQTGQPYEIPPALRDPMPSLSDTLERWQERVSLIPGPINRRLVASYRGVSTALANNLITAAGLDPDRTTDSLTPAQWQSLFDRWQDWLEFIINDDRSHLNPILEENGYRVMNWHSPPSNTTVNQILDRYYLDILDRQNFSQLSHQLTQKLSGILTKLRTKSKTFSDRLLESQDADLHKERADLLMAHLHLWQPGLQSIDLPDFTTGEKVKISLQPDKNAIQNAQKLYKQHQKLKRAKTSVEPLLTAVNEEIEYLEQIQTDIDRLIEESTTAVNISLETLLEIKQELIATGYINTIERSTKTASTTPPHKLITPSGYELLIGRNNRQNDLLSFKLSNEYDLWFHTQQIAGSHGLLRLPPGAVAETTDLQFSANAIAYYSRARHSQAVPVVYTSPKHVYKPKGAKPGMVIYKHERIIWGYPQASQ
jgi:predicted ribosome quality control (RQC) complex YloA/Tae2 family protein